MYIKCWGSRGSTPVSGKEYLKYGGDTTCLEIRTEKNDVIIIDAGTGIRKLGIQLLKEKITRFNFIFTHAHWDHLMGFPFFRPIFMDSSEINVYRCPLPIGHVEKMISRVMTPPNFPIKYSSLKAKITFKDACPEKFNIGGVTITPITLSHPNKGCGYKFTEGGKSFVFLTDNELGFRHKGGLPKEDYINFAKDADLLFHDAEFTPEEYKRKKEWGHSTYTDTVELAIASNVKRLGLFHINQDRTDEEMDEIVSASKAIIKKRKKQIQCFGVKARMKITL